MSSSDNPSLDTSGGKTGQSGSLETNNTGSSFASPPVRPIGLMPASSAACKLQAFPLVRSLQQRHSVVDLSACNTGQLDQDAVTMMSRVDKQQPRRTVASKRRPSASERQFKAAPILRISSSSNKLQQSVLSGPTLPSVSNDVATSSRSPRLPVMPTLPQLSTQFESQLKSVVPVNTVPCQPTVTATLEDAEPATAHEPLAAPDSAEPPTSPVPTLTSRVILKHFQERACAVYEPIVTSKALSSITPLFYRCVDYLAEHSNELLTPLEQQSDVPPEKPVLSDSTFSCETMKCAESSSSIEDDTLRLPGALSNERASLLNEQSPLPCLGTSASSSGNQEVLKKLNDVIKQFQEALRALDLNDTALLKLVYEIEREHTRLYEFQLQWCRENGTLNAAPLASDASEEPSVEGQPDATYSIPPWPAETLQRLEMLEQSRVKLDQLHDRGIRICKLVDGVICTALSSVLNLLESKMRDFPIDRALVKDSSLYPLLPIPCENGIGEGVPTSDVSLP